MESYNKVCEKCSGQLREEIDKYVCNYCTSEFIKNKNLENDIIILLNHAQKLRNEFDFDASMKKYEEILELNEKTLEAHWGYLLSKLGVIYVKENNIYKPTCNRLILNSIKEEKHFTCILSFSNEDEKKWYLREADEIESIRLKLLKISNSEEAYDIFISYKAVENSKPTLDSQLATDLYHDLVKKKYRVFMSRISLNNVVGDDYEPYIYNALNTSKLMLLISTKEEYLDSPWVRNEWTRFLNLKKISPYERKIIPIYRDINTKLIDPRLKSIQSLTIGDLNFYSTLTKNIMNFFNDSMENEVDKNTIKKIKVKELKRIAKKSKKPSLLKIKDLSLANNKTKLSVDENNYLKSGYYFLNNNLHDIAKDHFLKLYNRKSRNCELLFALILSELGLNNKITDLEIEIKNIPQSNSLENYLKEFLSLLDDSDENIQILEDLIFIQRIILTNINSFDYSIHAFLEIFKIIILTKESVFCKTILQEFILELRHKNLKLSSELVQLIYYSSRDYLLNLDENQFATFVNDLILEFCEISMDYNLNGIVKDALNYVPNNFYLLKVNFIMATEEDSFVDALKNVIMKKKYDSIDKFLSSVDNPRIEIVNILNQIKQNEAFVSNLKIKNIVDFSLHIMQYLPNFSVTLYTEQLNKFGFYCLKYNFFQEAKWFFQKTLSYTHNEYSLWGLLLSKASCSDEYDLVRKKIELNKFNEYNQLISSSKNIQFYNDIYLAIKKSEIFPELKEDILNRWQILEI